MTPSILKHTIEVLLATFLALSCGCSRCRDSQRIHIVVEDGFQGFFWLVLDPSAPRPTVSEGRVIVKVVDPSYVAVSDDIVIRCSQSITCSTVSGTIVPSETDDSAATSSSKRILFQILATSEGEYLFLIGSLDKRNEVLDDNFSLVDALLRDLHIEKAKRNALR